MYSRSGYDLLQRVHKTTTAKLLSGGVVVVVERTD